MERKRKREREPCAKINWDEKSMRVIFQKWMANVCCVCNVFRWDDTSICRLRHFQQLLWILNMNYTHIVCINWQAFFVRPIFIGAYQHIEITSRTCLPCLFALALRNVTCMRTSTQTQRDSGTAHEREINRNSEIIEWQRKTKQQRRSVTNQQRTKSEEKPETNMI